MVHQIDLGMYIFDHGVNNGVDYIEWNLYEAQDHVHIPDPDDEHRCAAIGNVKNNVVNITANPGNVPRVLILAILTRKMGNKRITWVKPSKEPSIK